MTPPWIRPTREITLDEARAMFPETPEVAPELKPEPTCTPDCGELHTHCEDCGAVVDITERNACTSGCSRMYARCQACALDHWETYHQRQESNRPNWERVP